MDAGASSAVVGVLVVDASGSIFSVLRSLNLGLPLWRVTSPSDVALTDIALALVAVYDDPDWSAITSLSEQITTVLVAKTPNDQHAMHAVAVGAFGYVHAQLPPEALRRSIVGATQGEHAYSRRVLAELIRSGRWLRAANSLPLTPRQRQVITLIARGAADKEIARSLGITTATAQKHVTNLLRRLNVPNRAAAVAAMAGDLPAFVSY
jgi:DNA-binding NarL/FixJ family response regulator